MRARLAYIPIAALFAQLAAPAARADAITLDGGRLRVYERPDGMAAIERCEGVELRCRPIRSPDEVPAMTMRQVDQACQGENGMAAIKIGTMVTGASVFVEIEAMEYAVHTSLSPPWREIG